MKDIFIACVNGLKGFPQAIETTFPKSQVQLCVVHLVRAKLELCFMEAAAGDGERFAGNLYLGD